MTTTPTTIPVPPTFWAETPQRDANEARAYDRGLEPCVVCGRGVHPGKGWVVVVTDGGSSLVALAAFDADPAAWSGDAGYMGAWTIGPECGKGIPAAYRERNGEA